MRFTFRLPAMIGERFSDSMATDLRDKGFPFRAGGDVVPSRCVDAQVIDDGNALSITVEMEDLPHGSWLSVAPPIPPDTSPGE